MSTIDASEACRVLGEFVRGEGKTLSRSTLSQWIKERGVPHYKFPRRLAFDRDALLRWAQSEFARN